MNKCRVNLAINVLQNSKVICPLMYLRHCLHILARSFLFSKLLDVKAVIIYMKRRFRWGLIRVAPQTAQYSFYLACLKNFTWMYLTWDCRWTIMPHCTQKIDLFRLWNYSSFALVWVLLFLFFLSSPFLFSLMSCSCFGNLFQQFLFYSLSYPQ